MSERVFSLFLFIDVSLMFAIMCLWINRIAGRMTAGGMDDWTNSNNTSQDSFASFLTIDSSNNLNYNFDVCGNYLDLSINPVEFENQVRNSIDISGVDANNTKANYDATSDVQYHLTDEEVLKLPDGIGASGTFVQKDNKVEYIPWKNTISYPVYYTPGTLPFSPYTYVPTYTDSVIARASKDE